METAEIKLKPTIKVRDNTSRFISAVKSGLADAIAEMAEDGATIALELAPKGHKADSRTASIQASFYHHSDGKEAVWGNTARHALAQEEGGKPHPISGWVNFYWEREGRDWEPGHNIIRHPGNPSRAYLRPSFIMVTAKYEDYLERHLIAGAKY